MSIVLGDRDHQRPLGGALLTAKHTGVYVRVSTTCQDHASQLPDLKRRADVHDGPIVWYRDKFTGKTMDRPGMPKLLDALGLGKLERIVVWRLARLTAGQGLRRGTLLVRRRKCGKGTCHCAQARATRACTF